MPSFSAKGCRVRCMSTVVRTLISSGGVHTSAHGRKSRTLPMSSRPAQAALNFAALDGLAFAAGRGRLDAIAPETKYAVGPIGPLMELRQFSIDGLLPHPDKAAWLDLRATASFEAALRAGRQQWVDGERG